MARPTLAFVDHELHKKTKSAVFLRELFAEHFDVHDYWDESWRGGKSVSPEELNKHDCVFYLQVINPVHELRQIRVPILWAPMYDGFKRKWAYFKVISQLNIKILSFSTTMSAWLSQFPIPIMDVHYYYLRPERAPEVAGRHIFFWYRGGVEFSDLRRIFDPAQIDSFTVLEVPDKAGAKVAISKEDMERYKVTYLVEDFLSRDRYLELVRKASVFVAPRRKEGIGAFTEALAMGKCVVAYDDAVHNEYITHGKDGFLFTERSGVLDLSRTKEMADTAFNRAQEGYQQWLINREYVVPFMLERYKAKQSALPFSWWYTLYRVMQFKDKVRYYLTHRLPRKLGFS